MKKHEIVAIVIFILLVGASFYFKSDKGTVLGVSAESEKCDPALWDHVYKSDRLEVHEECTTVAGTIMAVKMERDGDYHIRLKLDEEYKSFLNEKNAELVDNELVLEPVCENPVLENDAVDACRNFYGSIGIPPVGRHVFVTGSFVTDTTHGWNEIHPVSSIISK